MKSLIELKNRGNQLIKKNKFEQALVEYNRALLDFQRQVDNDEIRDQQQMFRLIKDVKIPCQKNIALCYLKLNKFKECVQECDQILKIDPQCEKTLYRKGLAYMESQQLEEAESILKRCYFTKPDSVETMKALSRIEELKQKRQKKIQLDLEEPKKPLWRMLLTIWLGIIFWFISIFNDRIFRKVTNRDLPFYNQMRKISEW